MTDAAVRVLDRHRDTTSLSADALAPLARAAAVTFQASGAPATRTLARRYADAMLKAQVPGQGFFGAARPGEADPDTTAAAGLALVDVYTATGDERYRAAAEEAVRAITSPALGWEGGAPAVGVRAQSAGLVPIGQVDGAIEIALTAQAGEFLDRAARELDVRSMGTASGAFETVLGNQAALGNWYAAVGSAQPQSTTEWATTLNALLSAPDRAGKRVGVATGGTSKLSDAAFEASGEPRDESAGGVARAMVTLALLPDQTDAVRVLGRAAERQGDDGSVAFSDPADPVAQGYAALAFAIRARKLLQPSAGA